MAVVCTADPVGAAMVCTAYPADRSVVLGHQLRRPHGLSDTAARGELAHVRLDVEHRGAVDGVETLDVNAHALDAQQPAARHAQAIGARLAPLGEDADERPVGATPGMPRRRLDRALRHAVEEVHYLEVRER